MKSMKSLRIGSVTNKNYLIDHIESLKFLVQGFPFILFMSFMVENQILSFPAVKYVKTTSHREERRVGVPRSIPDLLVEPFAQT